ncbi:MAG: hypothetical protein IT357_04600 [Gemmatimonadaceae bacterium]|nr:hypothetical protein [Gemmatimonadaceae bacterium]
MLAQPTKRPGPSEVQTFVREVPFSKVAKLGPAEVTIGSEDEEGPTLFSGIAGAILDRAGFMYLLDPGSFSVRAFDRTGKFVSQVGRSGRGPGEFTQPFSILHDGDSTLYVADNVNGVSVFRARAGQMTFLRAWGRTLAPRALCILGGRLMLAGWSNGKMLHVLDDAGNAVRSFGDGLSSDTNAVVREYENKSPVAISCDERSGSIILAQQSGSRVVSYSSTGAKRWSVDLPFYRGTWFFVPNRPPAGITTVYGEDVTVSMFYASPSRLLLQVIRWNRVKRTPGQRGKDASDIAGIRTFLIDAESGRLLSVSTDAPQLRSWRDGTAVEVVTEPYPMVTRRRLSFNP